MMISNPSLATVIVAAVIAVTLFGVLNRKRIPSTKEQYPLPPGPPARWFWNSIMPTATRNLSSTLNDLANEYGPVITLRRGSEVAVVVARVNAAIEIMEREGSALADRPPMIAAAEILSGGKRIVLTGRGERFRLLRKAVHTHLQPKAVETYKDIQFEQARVLVLDILDDAKGHREYAERYSMSIVLRITYGKPKSASINDPDFIGVKQVVDHFMEAMRPGAYLVDRFPWLKYVPGYGRRLKRYHDSDLEFYRGQMNNVKSAMSSLGAAPSFSRTLLENVHDHQLSFDEMSFLAGTLFEAGSDTTANAIEMLIMAAACFPDAQLRVQEELDAVVGMDRVPSWSDRNDLPQLHAFISETLRWRPVAPVGISHRSTREIIWNGYRIPAGTTVSGNQWSISRDPVAFPDPEKFDPNRWLDQNGQLRSDVDCFPFGFGRRVCPAAYLANRSLFIALALLLWSYRIVERPEAPIDTTPDRDSVIAHPAQFEAEFVLRIPEARLKEAMTM